MPGFYKYKILPTITLLSLLLGACGPSSAQSQDQISTAVAQTVQAQNSLTEVAGVPTSTPAPVIKPSPTTDLNTTSTPAPVVGNPGCTVSAVLAAENPPDGALLQPGDNFWKTWSLTNTGTCIWDSSYKLIYSNGDLMGGLASYPLPEPIAPGETKDISIYLKAPDTVGTFTGYWLLQTPWQTSFGVGPSSIPFYVKVNVTSDVKPKYGITSVTYTINRNPETGCPTNVWYTIYATITTDGPYEFTFYWDQSDGNEGGTRHLIFTEAGSQTFSRVWKVGRGDSPNPRWMQIIVTSPKRQEFDKFVFQNNCP